MEISVLIIIVGTLFTLALILASSIVIVLAQKKKTEALIKYQELAITRQKEISENTMLSQEKERQRVGLELHDDLGPSFAAIRNNLARVVSQLDHNHVSKAKEISLKASKDLKDAINKFSDVSKILYPVILNRNGLEAAIKDLGNKLSESGTAQINIKLGVLNISNDLHRLVLFRITQELFTNAQKHAEATEISLEIFEEEGSIHLNYLDDGVGFYILGNYQGLGLGSIKGRVAALDGTVEFITAPTNGLLVRVRIPNEKDSNS
jgi:signal transduction histidine kinase